MDEVNRTIDITQNELCSAIRKTGWGYVLLHLNFSLGTLNILPDWLGYVLFLSAIPVLAREDESAGLLRPLGILLALWSGLLWVTSLVGISPEWYAPEMIAAVIGLYFHFQLLTNLANIAGAYNCPEQSRILHLRTVRTLLLTLTVFPIPWQSCMPLTVTYIAVNIIITIWICSVLFALGRSILKVPVEHAE